MYTDTIMSIKYMYECYETMRASGLVNESVSEQVSELVGRE